LDVDDDSNIPGLSMAQVGASASRASTPSHGVEYENTTLDLSIIEPEGLDVPWFCKLAEAYPSDDEKSLVNGDDENAVIIDSCGPDDSSASVISSAGQSSTSKKQECPACGLKVTQRQRHLRTHLPPYVIPNQCCWDCGYAVRQATQFKQHRRVFGCSPAGEYSIAMDLTLWAQLVHGLLARICTFLGIPGILALYEYVKANPQLHPDPLRTTFSSIDKLWMHAFEAVFGPLVSNEEPRVNPINRFGLLSHWRVIFNLLQQLPRQDRDLLRSYRGPTDVKGYPILKASEEKSVGPANGADSHFHHEKMILRSGLTWDQLDFQFVRDTDVILKLAVTCYAFPETWPEATVHNSKIQILAQHVEPAIMITVGWHPTRCHLSSDVNVQLFHELLQMPWCAAAGEIGLDYCRGRSDKERSNQRSLLGKILPSIVSARLPVVLHCRNAIEEEISAHHDCIAILERVLPRLWPIYIHCFNGSVDEARLWLRAFPMARFGISSILLQHRAHPDLKTVVQRLDARRLLLESDAPYFLTDVTQFPSSIGDVGREVARLKGITLSQVFESAEEATRMFYRPVPHPH
jgi:TatD DNase family protein